MTKSIDLPCDGCGQISSPAHIAQRLQRLEWTTRYRPVHIQTLLLCAASPQEEKEFLYSPRCEFQGEAARLLEVAGIAAAGKTGEAVQAEFQRAGFFLTHILECAFESEARDDSNAPSIDNGRGSATDGSNVSAMDDSKRLLLLEQRLPATATRIRRSLKPKRVALISRELEPLVEKIAPMQLGCPIVLDGGKPFALDCSNAGEAAKRLREALAIRMD
jgi:hypothetical protein